MSMRFHLSCVLLAGVIVLAAPQASAELKRVTSPDAPRSLTVDGQVDVRWADPAEFSDVRNSTNRSAAERGDWVVDLAQHLRKRAAHQLPAGERLEVRITDIRRAGSYEPWLGVEMQDVRVLRGTYPPRITLEFERVAPDGHIIAQGERKLVDAAYLQGVSALNSDPLRYEKVMLDRWVQRELRAGG